MRARWITGRADGSQGNEKFRNIAPWPDGYGPAFSGFGYPSTGWSRDDFVIAVWGVKQWRLSASVAYLINGQPASGGVTALLSTTALSEDTMGGGFHVEGSDFDDHTNPFTGEVQRSSLSGRMFRSSARLLATDAFPVWAGGHLYDPNDDPATFRPRLEFQFIHVFDPDSAFEFGIGFGLLDRDRNGNSNIGDLGVIGTAELEMPSVLAGGSGATHLVELTGSVRGGISPPDATSVNATLRLRPVAFWEYATANGALPIYSGTTGERLRSHRAQPSREGVGTAIPNGELNAAQFLV